MAKAKAPSKHSRAARRAPPPPAPRNPSSPLSRPPDSILALRHDALVPRKRTKPCRKSIPSTRARRRAQRGADMAVAVVERTGVKIERSKGKARVSKERRRGWEDVNKMAAEGKVGGNGGNGFGVLVEDEEMGGVEEEGGGEERGGEGEGEEKVVEEDGDEIL